MVARHQQKVPALLYEPARRPLRTIGDVIGPMPLPGDPSGGPMHRLPICPRLPGCGSRSSQRAGLARAAGLDLSSVGIESYGQHPGRCASRTGYHRPHDYRRRSRRQQRALGH